MIPIAQFATDRKECIDSVDVLLERKREEALLRRKAFFCPDTASVSAYEASLAPYRAALAEMLGWPLNESGPSKVSIHLLDEETGGRVYKVKLVAFGRVKSHGLLFLPKAEGRYPLVFALHGRSSTPEMAAGMVPGAPPAHNALISGLRAQSVAVFAPQLLVWDKEHEPALDLFFLDRQFRHLGGSRMALEILLLRGFMDGLCVHPEIDPARMGVTGLSVGGFYALLYSALEPRFRVTVCSAGVIERFKYVLEDFVWLGIGNRFLDSEMARMICPRALFLESGRQDPLYHKGQAMIAEEAGTVYAKLGIPERFHSRLHAGAHEYDPDGEAQDFLLRWLLE